MKQQKQQKEYGKKFFVPILLILAVLPLITNAHIYDNGLSKQLWSSANGQVTDFFLYYKSHFLMILGAIVTVILAYWLCTGENGRLFDKNVWIPLIPASMFALFSLFSAMGAEHAEDAFLGGYEQFEGVFVLLIYVICFLFVYGYVKKEEVVEWLLNGLTAGSCVVGILGAFQTFGLDWIQSAWARPLVTTELAGRSGFNIKLTFGKGMAYSTLHNPNYVFLCGGCFTDYDSFAFYGKENDISCTGSDIYCLPVDYAVWLTVIDRTDWCCRSCCCSTHFSASLCEKAFTCFGWSGCRVYCCGGLRARCKTRHFKPVYGQRGRKNDEYYFVHSDKEKFV